MVYENAIGAAAVRALSITRCLPLLQAGRGVSPVQQSPRLSNAIQQGGTVVRVQSRCTSLSVLEEPLDSTGEGPGFDDGKELLSAVLDRLDAAPFLLATLALATLSFPALSFDCRLPLRFLSTLHDRRHDGFQLSHDGRDLTRQPTDLVFAPSLRPLNGSVRGNTPERLGDRTACGV